ncbi:hypothetical protein GCM10027217_45810 [Pseudomaricurvus hydrocarbonicus]
MRYTISLFFFILVGCTSSGIPYQPASDPSNGKSLLYVYRVKSDCGNGGGNWLIFDKNKHSVLSVQNYTYLYASPGDHFLGITASNYPASGQNISHFPK